MRRGRRLGAGGTGPLLVLVARRDTYIAASLEAQRRRAMFVHFRQKQLGSFETCHLAQGRFIHQQIVQLARPIGHFFLARCCLGQVPGGAPFSQRKPVQSAKCTVARIVRLSSCSVAQPCVLCFLQQPVSWSTFVLYFLHAQ